MPLMTASSARVTAMTLRRWAKAGKMVAIDRGIYIPTEESDQDHLELAAAVMRRPEGVVVLLSALHLHGIGTHIPQVVWLGRCHQGLPTTAPTAEFGFCVGAKNAWSRASNRDRSLASRSGSPPRPRPSSTAFAAHGRFLAKSRWKPCVKVLPMAPPPPTSPP